MAKKQTTIDYNTVGYDYIINREQSINDDLSQPYINKLREKYNNADLTSQMKMLGIKGRKTPLILTPEQDAAKTTRKHEEISLQAKFCNWMRLHYPEIKFLRHEREKARSKFMQNQMQVLNSAGSMPDWETTYTNERYTGLLIEFKKPGEKWLLQDNETMKPEYVHQYHCHTQLWKQRRVVYFCNDFDIACMIWEQYKEGRIMRQRVYKYPEKFAYLEEIL